MQNKELKYDELHELCVRYGEKLLGSDEVKGPIVEKAQEAGDKRVICELYIEFVDKLYSEILFKVQSITPDGLSLDELCEFFIMTVITAETYRRFGIHAMHRDLRIEAQLIQEFINNDQKIKEYILKKLEHE